jgi:hypothetical protein
VARLTRMQVREHERQQAAPVTPAASLADAFAA